MIAGAFMFLLDAVTGAALALGRWVAVQFALGFVEGVLGGDMFNRQLRGEKKAARERVTEAAAAGDVAALENAFRELAGEDRYRSLRIDILGRLAQIDQSAARTVLGEALASDDAWIVLAALDAIAKRGLVELRDAVRLAEQDPRRAVAKFAQDAGDRLDKRRLGDVAR